MLHCTQPEYTAQHQWVESDLVIWDNSSVLHRAEILGLPAQGLRLHHRVSTKGSPVSRLPRDCDEDDWIMARFRLIFTVLRLFL